MSTEIEWWFPGGFRLVYSGTPKSRLEWVRLTWRGYIAMWQLLFRAAWIMFKQNQETQ